MNSPVADGLKRTPSVQDRVLTVIVESITTRFETGADPGFFLGGV